MVSAWDAERARAVIEAHQSLRGALLPILHELQELFGYIDDEAVPLLALGLNLSQAEIHGVVSFYHEFRRQRPGRHVVKICVAEACQARGSASLLDGLKAKLGVALGETSADGEFSLEAVYCLGNCALGPSALLDGQLLGHVTPSRLAQRLAPVKEAAQ